MGPPTPAEPGWMMTMPQPTPAADPLMLTYAPADADAQAQRGQKRGRPKLTPRAPLPPLRRTRKYMSLSPHDKAMEARRRRVAQRKSNEAKIAKELAKIQALADSGEVVPVRLRKKKPKAPIVQPAKKRKVNPPGDEYPMWDEQ